MTDVQVAGMEPWLGVVSQPVPLGGETGTESDSEGGSGAASLSLAVNPGQTTSRPLGGLFPLDKRVKRSSTRRGGCVEGNG